MDTHDDTIAAIATPPGLGGIGIIKISGDRATAIAAQVFRPRHASPPFKSHRLYYGEVVDPDGGYIIDEALLSYMAKPRSYTREDVVEINCHSGYTILHEILSLVIRVGARLAEPGEFTKRAFLNGRIDLTQAEAVMNLINAKSTVALKCASSQLKGMLSHEINALRDELVEVLAVLEASIDFPEEVNDYDAETQTMACLDRALGRAERLLNSYSEGRLYREGISTVIAGKPNVGKSSLFNALLGEERTIVTSFPGTTRDFIEELITIKGIPIKLIDTAGLRVPENSIEAEGLKITKDKLDSADVIILVIDGSRHLDEQDETVFTMVKEKRVVVACNKTDLPRKVSPEELRKWFPVHSFFSISALHKTGLEDLRGAIVSLLTSQPKIFPSSPLVTDVRHHAALKKAASLLRNAREGVFTHLPSEFIASEIQGALYHLGEITGQTTPEEILNQIFRRFCIGK